MKLRKWLRTIFLFPVMVFLGAGADDTAPVDDGNSIDDGDASAVVADTDGDAKGDNTKGDNTKPDDFDPDFLADLAKDDVVPDATGNLSDKPGFIPKARFDEVNDKARTATEEAARLRGELAALKKNDDPPPDPLAELEDKVVDAQIAVDTAILDFGLNSTQHREAVKSLAKLNREVSRFEAETTVTTAKTKENEIIQQARQVQDNVTAVVQKAYVDYPFLDHTGQASDPVAQQAVVELRDTLVAAGIPIDKALSKAVETLGPVYAKMVAKVPEVETAEVKAIREAREKAAREKAARATTSQPPIVQGRSDESSFKIDSDKLTDKEYAALPEDKKNEMLGLA